MRSLWIGCLLGAVLFGSLQAEMQNHYVLGTNGLNSAVKLPAGFAFTSIYKHYHASSLRDNNGRKVHLNGSSSHLNVQYLQNFLSYYSCCTLLGGFYGCQINAPFETTSIDSTFFNSSFDVGNHMRFSDLYVEPINVRWQWDRFYLFAAYGFYAPTGNYQHFSLNNSGMGSWGNMLTLAATIFFDCESTLSLSAYATYEVHSKTRGIDFTAGDNLCIDWGFGKTFGTYFALGIVGYYERQTTKDRGRDVPFIARNVQDYALAVGGEFDITIPQLNGGLTFRYLQEYDVSARTKGDSFIAQIGFEY